MSAPSLPPTSASHAHSAQQPAVSQAARELSRLLSVFQQHYGLALAPRAHRGGEDGHRQGATEHEGDGLRVVRMNTTTATATTTTSPSASIGVAQLHSDAQLLHRACETISRRMSRAYRSGEDPAAALALALTPHQAEGEGQEGMAALAALPVDQVPFVLARLCLSFASIAGSAVKGLARAQGGEGDTGGVSGSAARQAASLSATDAAVGFASFPSATTALLHCLRALHPTCAAIHSLLSTHPGTTLPGSQAALTRGLRVPTQNVLLLGGKTLVEVIRERALKRVNAAKAAVQMAQAKAQVVGSAGGACNSDSSFRRKSADIAASLKLIGGVSSSAAGSDSAWHSAAPASAPALASPKPMPRALSLADALAPLDAMSDPLAPWFERQAAVDRSFSAHEAALIEPLVSLVREVLTAMCGPTPAPAGRPGPPHVLADMTDALSLLTVRTGSGQAIAQCLQEVGRHGAVLGPRGLEVLVAAREVSRKKEEEQEMRGSSPELRVQSAVRAQGQGSAGDHKWSSTSSASSASSGSGSGSSSGSDSEGASSSASSVYAPSAGPALKQAGTYLPCSQRWLFPALPVTTLGKQGWEAVLRTGLQVAQPLVLALDAHVWHRLHHPAAPSELGELLSWVPLVGTPAAGQSLAHRVEAFHASRPQSDIQIDPALLSRLVGPAVLAASSAGSTALLASAFSHMDSLEELTLALAKQGSPPAWLYAELVLACCRAGQPVRASRTLQYAASRLDGVQAGVVDYTGDDTGALAFLCTCPTAARPALWRHVQESLLCAYAWEAVVEAGVEAGKDGGASGRAGRRLRTALGMLEGVEAMADGSGGLLHEGMYTACMAAASVASSTPEEGVRTTLTLLRRAQARGLLGRVQGALGKGSISLSGIPQPVIATVLLDCLQCMQAWHGQQGAGPSPPSSREAGLAVYHRGEDREHIRGVLQGLCDPPLLAQAVGKDAASRHLLIAGEDWRAYLDSSGSPGRRGGGAGLGSAGVRAAWTGLWAGTQPASSSTFTTSFGTARTSVDMLQYSSVPPSISHMPPSLRPAGEAGAGGVRRGTGRGAVVAGSTAQSRATAQPRTQTLPPVSSPAAPAAKAAALPSPSSVAAVNTADESLPTPGREGREGRDRSGAGSKRAELGEDAGGEAWMDAWARSRGAR